MAKNLKEANPPALYSGRDVVTNLLGITGYLNKLLDEFGYSHISIEGSLNEKNRLWIGGTILCIQRPKEFVEGYFQKCEKVEADKIPKGYSVRSESDGKRGKAYVPYGELGDVIGTIGHEIFGHLLSPELKTDIDEEGKAYAFQSAWNMTIEKMGLAGLVDQYERFRKSVPDMKKWPAHHIAHKTVTEMIANGYAAMKLYEDFCHRRMWIPVDLD